MPRKTLIKLVEEHGMPGFDRVFHDAFANVDEIVCRWRRRLQSNVEEVFKNLRLHKVDDFVGVGTSLGDDVLWDCRSRKYGDINVDVSVDEDAEQKKKWKTKKKNKQGHHL